MNIFTDFKDKKYEKKFNNVVNLCIEDANISNENIDLFITDTKNEIENVKKVLISEIKGQGVYKYQDIRNIIKSTNRDESDVGIIGFFSVRGKVGKTTIALNLAKKLAEKDEKVIYINLEEIDSSSKYLDDINSNNMSKILYDLRKNKKNISKNIGSSYKYNFDYILGIKNFLEYEKIKKKEIKKLLNILKCDYKYIILDLKTGINNKFMQLCNKKYLVSENKDVYKLKNTNFFLEKNNFKVILNKYTKGNILYKSAYITLSFNKGDFFNLKVDKLL